MAYSYNNEHSYNSNSAYTCLITTHTLNAFINLFVSTFLVAHIYSFNGDTYAYLFNVAIFNIAYYLCYIILYIPFSKIVDRTNRIIMYKIGIIVKTALVIFFIFCGEQLAKLLILAGIINALGDALYYSSYNVLRQEMISKKQSSSFASFYYILSKIVEIVCPIILGTLIDIFTFSYTAIVVCVVCIVQIIVSSFIKAQKPDGSTFNLKAYIGSLKNNPNIRKRIVYMYYICAIYGVSILTTTLMNICVMLEYGSNFSLGMITGLLSICSVITIILMNKFTKAGSRSWMFLVSAIAPIIAVIVFVFNINKTTIIILNGVILITAIIYKVLFDAHRNSTLKEVGFYDYIAEHHSIIEILVGISRAFCFIIMIVIALIKNLIAFKVFIVVNVVLCSFIHLLLLLYEKKYFGNSVNCTKIKLKKK